MSDKSCSYCYLYMKKKSHVSSRNMVCSFESNLDREKWGPNAWKYLHIVSFTYPDIPSKKERLNIYKFILGFSHTIPCKQCRYHFMALIAPDLKSNENSIVFDSKDTLSRTIVRWHNAVNKRLSKPLMKYEDAIILYTGSTSNCTTKNDYKIILIFLVIVFVMMVRASKNHNKFLRFLSWWTYYDKTIPQS